MNHYEHAFVKYLRSSQLPCVPIDQSRRPREGWALGAKNPDFLVYPKGGLSLVVEVKGKRGRNLAGRVAWENWVTTDDLEGLVRWRAMYGPGFQPVLSFVYAEPNPTEGYGERLTEFTYEDFHYRFWAIGLDDYLAHLRSRGPAWRAVAMARKAFRERVRPLSEWLGLPPAVYTWRRRRRLRQAELPALELSR